MKFALVAALCGFAFAAYSHQSIEAKWFGPEKEFLYNWDSQLASGLPVDSTQHATQRIISKVALQLSSRSSAWLQLRGFAVYASQDTLRTPSRLAPVETFDPVPMSGEQKEALSLPVRFRYESGIVSGLEFDKQDPTWSRNIKRAALNMLQINLFSSNAVNEQNEFRETTENHYSVNETTLEGDCTVLYSKVADAKEWKESRSEEDEMMFSKSIEFSRCLRRPNVLYAMPLSDECKECEPHMSKHGREMPALQQNTVMRFRVAGGSVDRFIIREVELSSKYVFAPIADEKPFINNEVVAKLTLEKSGEIREKMPKIDSDRKECLMHSTRTGKAREQWEMNGDEESLEEIKRTGDYEEVEAAKKTINDIRELVEENVEVETSHMFARLISILRRATVKQITEIHRYCNEVDQKLSTIFIDAVAEAGTKHCVDYIVKLTIDGHVTPIRAAYLMKALASMRLPSQKIINALNNLAKESVCKENPVLEQSVRLTVGVLINGLCVNPKSRWAHSREEVCPENVKEKMSDDLRRLYGAAKSRYDKVLALKTIANSGLELIHPVLEKIIFDREEEPTVRMQAMDALRLLRLTMSRRIQKTLMPVYKSRSEPTEVRITALFHLLHTQPDHGTLQQIADQINNERNGHVAAYSYTMLNSFASSASPCQKHYAERCQIALRLVKDEAKTRCEKYNSFNLQASINSEMLLSAGSIELSSVFSNDSILPKELMASIDALFAGHWNKNFLQIGATQQGLDRILRETLPKVESVHSIDDVVTRGRRSLFDQPKQMLQGLIDKLSIVTRRRSDEAERDPHAVVYIRYRNMDYALIPIEEEYFRQWKSVVSDGKINLREIEKILAEGADLKLKTAAMVYEITRIIPTTFGMPISVNCKMPLVASIKLETSVDLLPKGEPSLKGVEMKVKGEPSVTITHLCHTMVLSPLAHTGIKLQNSILASLPIDASIRAEYKNKKILMTTSFKVPREEKILFKALTRPVTFVRKVALETRKYAEPIEKTIYVPRYEGLNKEYDMVYGEEILGLGFHVQGNLYNPFGHNKFLPIVANEKHMEIRAVPAKEPVSEYRVNSETELFVESSLPEWRVFNDFFTKDNRQHFAVEKDSEEEWDETERESGFKKNVEKESGLKGIGHRTKVDVEAFGGSKKRYANFEVKAACEKESLSKCHVSLNAHRTPLLKEERENCRAEANLYTMFPEEVSSLKELKEQKHREFNAILKGSFGCKKTNVINIKVQAEQNKEMKKWISFVDKAEVSEIDSFKLLKEAGYLNQYKLEAEYKLDEKYETAVAQGYRLLNAWNWWNSRMEAKRNPSGKISAIVEIEPETRRYVNVTVNTPETQVVMESMSVPVKIPLLNIFHPVEMRSYKSHEYSRSVCEVRSNKINTFDDVIYKTPLTTCYSIVAKDCSVEPTFAVLVKKMKKSGEEKKIKVVTEQNVIEMWLEKGEMQFRVNGKTVREDSISRYDIVQLADRVYKIELEQLSVRFDGRVVRVELSQSMKGRQCGLCGHYDDDHEDEFRRADNVHTDDIEEFHRSFFARDDKDCEIEEEKVKSKKNYGRIEESSEEASAFEEIEYGKAIADDEDIPVERQQVLEYARRTCFSRTAVKECPRGEPSRFERVTLRFVCLPRDSKEARRFVREIRRGFVPLDSYKDAFTQQMKTAIECRP